ncbi:MAG: ABC transporter ATP-binding protein [Pseudomonadota bacterium]
MTLLEITALTAQLGRRAVLDGVSLNVSAGEVVGLIGPNGAGKTTVLRAVMSAVAHGGEIRLGGAAAQALTPRERALRVAYLPQEREIAWPLTVERVVSLGREPHRRPGAGLRATDRAAIAAAMRKTDVTRLAHRPADALSGGERARVLIARALAQQAPLLLADEPTAGLDPAHQIALMETFSRLAAEGGAVLTSLHDLGLAARWCSRIVLLQSGRVIADGPPAETLSPARLRAVYGVDAYHAETADGLVVLPTRRLSGGGDPAEDATTDHDAAAATDF